MSHEQIAADPARWAKERQSLITASDVASIARVRGSFGSPAAVYWNKIAGDKLPDRLAMRIGRALEPLAADIYAEDRGTDMQPAGLWASDEYPWLAATFDYFATETNSLGGTSMWPVEIKTDASPKREGWGDPPYGEIPPRYHTQALIQMAVGEFDHLDLAVLFLPSGPMHVYTIDRDAEAEEDISALVWIASQFRAHHLQRRIPPAADSHPATTAALRRVYLPATDAEQAIVPVELWHRALSAKAAVDRAEQRRTQAENELRTRMGYAVEARTRGGALVARRSIFPNRRVSVRMVRALHPDVAHECTVTNGDVDKLLIKEPKEN